MKLRKSTEITEPFTALIYGDAGAGKTWLAGTAQKHEDMREVLFLDYDRGLSTLQSEHNILSIKPDNYKDLVNIITSVVSHSGDYKVIKTVVIDSLTSMQLDLVATSAKDGYEERQKGRVDQFSVQIQDYNHAIFAIRWVIQTLKTAGLHLILLSPIKAIMEDNSKGEPEIVGWRPDVSPAMWSSLAYSVSNIWFLTKQSNGARRVLVAEGKNSKYFIKTRNPDYVKRLTDFTKQQAAERGTDPATAEGWVYIADPNFLTLPVLYDLRKGIDNPA